MKKQCKASQHGNDFLKKVSFKIFVNSIYLLVNVNLFHEIDIVNLPGFYIYMCVNNIYFIFSRVKCVSIKKHALFFKKFLTINLTINLSHLISI